MPSLHDAVLMVEDDYESHSATFARDLTSLLQLPDAAGVRGLAIGRFQLTVARETSQLKLLRH